MTVDQLLLSIPPLAVYLVVALVISLESMGVPLPGEVTLVAAALHAPQTTVGRKPSATLIRSM